MSQNSRPPTTPSPDSEMSDSSRPRYFLVRDDGTLTPLVAVDELPASIRILGVPAVLSYANTQGMVSLGVAARSERRYILESSTYSSPNRIGTPSSGQPAMISRPDATEEQVKASDGGIVRNEASRIQRGHGTQAASPNAAVLIPGQSGQQVETWRQGVSSGVDEIQVRPSSTFPGPCHLTLPQATVDAIVDAASRNGTATANAATTTADTSLNTLSKALSPYSPLQTTPPSSNTANANPAIFPPASSPPITITTAALTTLPPTTSNLSSLTPSPKKKEKVYCSFWIRRGECDYTQQGCLYKHEMPTDRETLRELGISMIPRWWREANAVKVGGSGWSERTGLGAGKEKEKGMWRAGAGAQGAKGQRAQGLGVQGLGVQGQVTQTPTTFLPPQMKGSETMRTMMAAQVGGRQQFTATPRAASVAVTPAPSPIGFSFPRQMMGSHNSPPAATPAHVPAATPSPSFSFGPAPAPALAHRQQYAPTTPNGYSSQMPVPSPVGVPPAGSRLSPSSAEGTTPTTDSGNATITGTQSIPIPCTPNTTHHQSAIPSTSPPGPTLLPAYQPLTPSSPRPTHHSSASSPSPVPQPKPVSSFDIFNGVPTPPQVHRRLFVTAGQSQFVTVAPAESGSKKAPTQDEEVRHWNQKSKGSSAEQKNGVLVEFGEG